MAQYKHGNGRKETHWTWRQKNRTHPSKQQRKKHTEKKSLGELWGNNKTPNIHITGAPERKENERQTEIVFEEIMAKNFSIVSANPKNWANPKQNKSKEIYTKTYNN